MKAKITEMVLVPHKEAPDAYLTIKCKDNGAGPFLCIEGHNLFPEEGDNEHEFYLETYEQADEFVDACKMMLKDNADEGDEYRKTLSTVVAFSPREEATKKT